MDWNVTTDGQPHQVGLDTESLTLTGPGRAGSWFWNDVETLTRLTPSTVRLDLTNARSVQLDFATNADQQTFCAHFHQARSAATPPATTAVGANAAGGADDGMSLDPRPGRGPAPAAPSAEAVHGPPGAAGAAGAADMPTKAFQYGWTKFSKDPGTTLLPVVLGSIIQGLILFILWIIVIALLVAALVSTSSSGGAGVIGFIGYLILFGMTFLVLQIVYVGWVKAGLASIHRSARTARELLCSGA